MAIGSGVRVTPAVAATTGPERSVTHQIIESTHGAAVSIRVIAFAIDGRSHMMAYTHAATLLSRRDAPRRRSRADGVRTGRAHPRRRRGREVLDPLARPVRPGDGGRDQLRRRVVEHDQRQMAGGSAGSRTFVPD